MTSSQKYRRIIKLGAIISTVGVVMIISFGLTLLLFPVTKICDDKCNYILGAPDLLKRIVNPLFLFVSLILISLGVFLIRIGNRQIYRKP
ncbi:MAG TPA: hypothetical protein VFG45_10165 [Candidatus Nitrosocosmicus sp.]|jgi:predicted nucleic acid-binding Zn ribbon protein|nr:hypothetical protein [Candidatus Nitrosocosmicus sp.]